MQKIARFAVRYHWYVIGAWVAIIVGTQLLSSAAGGGDYKDVFRLPHTETQTVFNLLKASGQGGQNGQLGTVVVHATSGSIDSEPAGLEDRLAKVCSSGNFVTSISSPWSTVSCTPGTAATAGNPALLDPAKDIALVNITWSSDTTKPVYFTNVYDELKTYSAPNTELQFTGDGFAPIAEQQKGIPPEAFGFIAALIILAIVFRTFGATVLPLLSAVAALTTGLSLIALLSHAMDVADFATELATLMVIGVGVDYALFIVTRHRRNLQKGMSVEDSIVLAINTSGRAVLFAGITVCIALLGLLALQVSFLYGVAVGTALAVMLTMVASLSLLPAMLSLLGRRILPRSQRDALPSDGRVKLLLCVIPPICVVFWILYGLQYLLRPVNAKLATRRASRTGPGFWARWSKIVEARSLLLGLGAAAVIIVLAIPFFSMRLGHADEGNDPAGTTTRVGYDLIAKGFGPGYNSTLELVVSGPTATDAAYLKTVSDKLATAANVDVNSIHSFPLGKDLAFVSFKSTTSPQDEKTTNLVKNLRSDVLPPVYNGTGNHIYVYGATAIQVDFAKVLSAKMPIFFAAVIGLSMLLLMVAFRSIVIPLTAAAMNLFAAGASFGVVVAIFQWGWFSETLGIGSGGPIEAFLPVMFFAILFGLSMDYQVFLVSRMHEEWVHTGDNRRAITVGQAETGGIITAAAIIMISVFGGFILGDSRVIKMFGIGLGGAVFLDAFVLRTVLVPSLMHLLGRSNWYFPKWLEWIPRVSVEPADEEFIVGDDEGERKLVNA